MFVSLRSLFLRLLLCVFSAAALMGVAIADGLHVWRVNALGSPVIFVAAVDADANGNAYVAGVRGNPDFGGIVVKLSSSGSIVWTQYIPGLQLADMKVSPDGEAFVSGMLDDKHFAAKLGVDGNELWRNTGLELHGSGARITPGSGGTSAISVEQYINNRPRLGYLVINPDGTSGISGITPLGASIQTIALDNANILYFGGVSGAQRVTTAASQVFPGSYVLDLCPDNAGACFGVDFVNPSSRIFKISAMGVVWRTTALQSVFYGISLGLAGKLIVAGADLQNNLSAMYRYSSDGVLEATATFDGFQTNDHVICDMAGNSFVTSVKADPLSVVVYLRKLSAANFDSMWVGTDIGGSISLPYGPNGSWHFVRNAAGDIFVTGMGSNGEMLVDKIIELDLSDFTVSPNPVNASRKAVGTLTLSGPSVGATTVTLSSSSSHAIVPSSVTFAEGQTTKAFTILTTDPPTAYEDAILKAKALGDEKTVTLRVLRANSAKYINCDIPLTVICNHTYTVRMTFYNTGILPWTTDYEYELRSENPVDNMRWHVNRMKLINGPVAPGHMAKFRAVVRAPQIQGNYKFQWMPIAGAAHGPFGTISGPTVHVVSDIAPASPPASASRRRRRKH